MHTQVVVLEPILSITRGIRVPVGKWRDPSGQSPRRINVWSERDAQRTEHNILVETQELDTDFPDIVCVSVWEMWQYRQHIYKFYILISNFNVLPVSFTMSVTERTYIMIKVRRDVQISSDC